MVEALTAPAPDALSSDWEPVELAAIRARWAGLPEYRVERNSFEAPGLQAVGTTRPGVLDMVLAKSPLGEALAHAPADVLTLLAVVDWMAARLDGYREELKRADAHHAGYMQTLRGLAERIDSLETKQAAAQDTARLNWLEQVQEPWHVAREIGGRMVTLTRLGIDAAMAADRALATAAERAQVALLDAGTPAEVPRG